MSLVIQADKLANTLKPLAYGVADNASMRQTNCVIFHEGKAYTFSGQIFALVTCDLGFDGAIDYKSFIAVLKKYGEAEVEISLVGDTPEESYLLVKKGRSRTKINYQPHILLSLSNLSMPISGAWKELPASFFDAVNACESVSNYIPGSDVLSSINITPTAMEAASTSQIIRYKCELDIADRFLVKTGLLGKIMKANPTHYQLVDRWFYIRSKEVAFAVPVKLDEFIDGIDNYLLPMDTEVTFTSDLLEDISLAQSILDKEMDVLVTLADNTCKMLARGTSAVHESECEMETPLDISFNISPSLFKRIVSEFPKCTIGQAGIRVHNDAFIYAASVK